MKVIKNQRKRQIAEYIVNVLSTLSLNKTANKLVDEASLRKIPKIQKQMRSIMDNIQTTPQKKQLLARQLIRQNMLTQALNIYQTILPKYIKDLTMYSMLFAGDIGCLMKQQMQIHELFIQTLTKDIILPQQRQGFIKVQGQVWFMEPIRDLLMAVTSKSNAYIILKDKVVSFKEGIHQGKILCLAASLQQLWATSGVDKMVKCWNSKLQCIYKMPRENNVYSMNFSTGKFAIFDEQGINNAYTWKKKSAQTNQIILQYYFRFKTNPIIDTRFLAENGWVQGWVAITKDKDKGELVKFAPNFRQCVVIADLPCQPYSLQVSPCRKYCAVNLKSNKIYVYSLNKSEAYWVFKDYVQDDCIMRMSIGGYQQQILAVSSQDGHTCLYSLKRKELIGKLRNISGKMNNTVAWVNDQLYTGCDAGHIERWKNIEPLNLQLQCQQIIPMQAQQQMI